jgi:cytidine deaminase
MATGYEAGVLGSGGVLTDQDLALVERARVAIAGVASDDNHRVAAAAYDSAGKVFTGVNVYHFSGGPCAEPVAMGNAVGSEGVRLPLTAMVAVLAGGEVIPPCGRCRQMLFDYYPEIRVIVRGRAGLVAMPIHDLLPYAYDQRSLGQQVLYLADDYLEAVRDGAKRTTIRVHDPVDPGPVRLVFERDDGSAPTLDALVTHVVSKPMSELDDADAVRDGFADRAELLAALGRHYPGLDPTRVVDVVHFRLPD